MSGNRSKRHVAIQAEVYRIFASVVPSSAERLASYYGIISLHSALRADKLLGFTGFGNRVLSEEKAAVNSQIPSFRLRIGDAVHTCPFGSGDFCLYRVLFKLCRIIAQLNLLPFPMGPYLGTGLPRIRLDEDISVFGATTCSAHVYLGEAVHPFGHRQPAGVWFGCAVG